MPHDSWTVLMVQDGPGMLSDDVRTALKIAACELHLKRAERMRIKSHVCEGFIETEWKTKVIGARSGVLFRCQIDSGGGNYRVNFLFSEKDLRRGADIIREIDEEGDMPWRMSETSRESHPVKELFDFCDIQAGGSTKLN